MFGMCIDKRVLGGLAIAAVGVLAVAPQLIVAALPLLLIAICPLSMLLMGKAMLSGGRRISAPASDPIETSYRTITQTDRTQQLALLEWRFQAVSEQQAALAAQLAQLQAAPQPSSIGSDSNDEAVSSFTALR